MVGDVDFEFMQGAELSRFYQNVLEKCMVNQKKLLRYASRRNRKKEVEQLIMKHYDTPRQSFARVVAASSR